MTARTGSGGVMLRLWRQLSPRRRWQAMLMVGLTLAGAAAEVFTLGAVFPFLALVVDPGGIDRLPALQRALAALQVAPEQTLPLLTAVVIVLIAVAGAARIGIVWVNTRFAARVGHEMTARLYERVLYQPYSFHISRNTSMTLAAIEKARMLTDGTLLPLLQCTGAAVIGLAITAALLIVVDPWMSLTAFVALAGTYTAVALTARARLRTGGLLMARMLSERVKVVQEGLGGIRNLLIDGTQPVFLRRFRSLDSRLRTAHANNTFIGSAPRFAIEAAGMVLVTLAAYAVSDRDGGVTRILPALGALALGAQRLLPLMQQVYAGSTQVRGNVGNAIDVLTVLEMPVGDEWNQPTGAPLPFERDIAFRDVSFRYRADLEHVLEHISLTIPRGARVGIIGTTGTGKSTLVDLLVGLLTPTAGSIEVDGQPLEAGTQRAWRRQIAHVPQAIFLSDASITENIAFGIEPQHIDHAGVREAARRAALAGFIEALPEGYDTLVGERGVRLSGGQRQRIGIARALYRNAALLVFDEATSALDVDTETAVLDAIDTLDRSVTIVIIAHRSSTTRSCDFVVTLPHGSIVPATPGTGESDATISLAIR